jgi:hypothetical protein
MKTYSSKSNAIRALKTQHPELCEGKTNQELADAFLAQSQTDKSFAIVIPSDVKVVKRHIYKGVQFRRRSVEPEGVAYYTARTQYQKWLRG